MKKISPPATKAKSGASSKKSISDLKGQVSDLGKPQHAEDSLQTQLTSIQNKAGKSVSKSESKLDQTQQTLSS